MEPLRADLQALIDDPTAFLRDDRTELRRMAASLLGPRAADQAIAAALTERLVNDEAPSVRAAAAEALAGSSDPTPLVAALGDEDPGVREAAVYALGEIGDRAAVGSLMEVASADADDGVREGAVAALGAIGDEAALPLLIELSSSAPPKVRRRTVVALSAFESSDALAAITAALKDRNPMVKEVAEMVVGGNPDELIWPTRRPSAG